MWSTPLALFLSKMKYMLICAFERGSNLYNLFIEDNSFDAVNKFRYLGNMIDNEGSINTTIHDRIQTDIVPTIEY